MTNEYIVRTRSDVETMQARTGDYSMFNAAMNSNAQIISTDYYREDPIIGSFKISLDSFKILSNLPLFSGCNQINNNRTSFYHIGT